MSMRIIVSDSSCLIDLHKCSLLHALLSLPYEFLIPNTLFEGELLSFTPSEKRSIIRAGLRVVDIPGKDVLKAQAIVRDAPRISIHDGFALVLSENHPNAILMTGDEVLRRLATQRGIEVHGVLWAIEEIEREQCAPREKLRAALEGFLPDPTVRLPRRELTVMLKRFEANEGPTE
jgi:predicted nucleic acid-binding protein